MSEFKEGDVVVILNAFPDAHNGKLAIVKYCHKFGGIKVFIPEVNHLWDCLNVRLATLLEIELQSE